MSAKATFFIFTLLALTAACVSPRKPHTDDPLAKANVMKRIENHKAKVKKDKDAMAKKPIDIQDKKPFGSSVEDRYATLLKPSLSLEEGNALVELVPIKAEHSETNPATLSSAVSVLAVFHKCLLDAAPFSHEGGANVANVSTNSLAKDSAPTQASEANLEGPTPGCSLSEITKETSIDLAAAIAANPFLHNAEALEIALRALEINADADTSTNARVLDALDSLGTKWPAFAENMAKLRSKVPAEGEAMQATATNDGSAIKYSAWEFHREEDLINQADELIAQGHYEAVVALLRKVDKNNIFYNNAQEKLVEACNQAAQKLRSQAATAFQSAIPVADKRARMEYFRQAEEHLQKALELYPEADQAETIRQNLDVIQKNLQALSSNPRSND